MQWRKRVATINKNSQQLQRFRPKTPFTIVMMVYASSWLHCRSPVGVYNSHLHGRARGQRRRRHQTQQGLRDSLAAEFQRMFESQQIWGNCG
jgi:hypothetical protein